jgi:Flp pilus assembly protein TadG
MMLARAWKDRRGATAVEMALTMPAFLMLTVGCLEYGMAAYTQLSLQHGVESAARCAAINTTRCGSPSATQSYAASQSYGLSPPVSTFNVAMASDCGALVQASYKFNFVTQYFGNPLTITASSCFPR